MRGQLRFGRRIPLPSTVQIIHDLKRMAADDEARTKCAREDGLADSTSWEAIGLHRAAAEERARRLLDAGR